MIGTVISHYRIVEKIGEGGMGEVYRAQDQRLPRSVAIKILPERALASPERRERFIREARAASSLNHPGIVHVYDVDEAAGRLFIAMEYVAGKTISAILEDRRIGVEETLKIAVEAGEALAAAHAHGIVHRDVKPSNIIVAHEGFVKILDFGLAKLLAPGLEDTAPDDASTRAPNLTRDGQLIGTVLYMSPELALGEVVDHRSDIFSFGAVLYETSTGRLPFTGGSEVAIIDQILHATPPPVTEVDPGLPDEFGRIVSKAMERKAENRYQRMEEVVVDLRNLLRSLQSTDVAPLRTGARAGVRSASRAARRPAVRRALVWVALAVAAALGAAALIDRTGGNLARAEERAQQSIAVIPFGNDGQDPESKYFSDGITEGIIVDLSRIEGLQVLAPPAASSAVEMSGLEQGRRLGASSILEGSVRRSEDRVRITARLLRLRDGQVLWADRIDRPLTGVFDLQDQVSHEIAQALQIRLTTTEKAMIARIPTSNLKAYDLYLQGRELASRRSPAELMRALGLFEQARDLDPNYALAYAGLADAFAVALMYGWETGPDTEQRAEAASRRAIALDPTLPEAHLVRGVVAGLEGDLDGGISRVLHAVSLAPDSARAHHWLSVLYKLKGAYEQAAAEDLVALRHDPDLAVAHFNLAHIAILSNHPDDAVARMEPLVRARPDLPLARVLLAWAYLRKSEPRRALGLLDAAYALSPEDPLVAGMRGMARAAGGDRGGALQEAKRAAALSEGAPSPAAEYAVACVYALTGHREEALHYLERALTGRALSLESIISPAYVRDDPVLAPLHADPRFSGLLGGLSRS